MKITLKSVLACALFLATAVCAEAKTASVASPDGHITATISDDTGSVTIAVSHDTTTLLAPSTIALDFRGAKAPRIGKTAISNVVTETIDATLYRQASFSVSYRTLTADLGNKSRLEVRTYDEGIAYRYVTDAKGQIVIDGETADYQLPADLPLWLPYSTNDDKPMAMAFQNYYDYTTASHAKDKLAFLPVTVDYGNGLKLTLTESDLRAYPGMFVKADTTALSLNARFAPHPSQFDNYPWRKQRYVIATHDYIYRGEGKRTYPWRVMAITTDDAQMPVNNLVYALAEPCKVADTSWIKPGKVAWDWWNDWGLRGVPFQAGINMDTYRYYIDFAAAHGIEYVILDEGWYDPKSGDMLTYIPEIDVDELVRYGADRGVGIVLWTVFNVLDDQLQVACEKYSALGVKGFKVDFLDRDDQEAVELTYRIAQACADHHLLLDYHGIYKPTGINRTYPNVINFEAVFGMEEMKWSPAGTDMPAYDVTFPYIRLLAGPVDYTPGAMRNATRADWHAVYSNPMSMGTRCHQLATYIVYDSPFTMLADSPSNYQGEDVCVDFITSVPNTVDETRILCGRIGEYIVTARRHGDDWWIGGMTNWDARDLTIDLAFLPDGKYRATVLTDGPNAAKDARDYNLTQYGFNARDFRHMSFNLAPGGGFALKLIKE